MLVKKLENQSLKNITYKVLEILIDYDSNIEKYNHAIDDYNELGGIDKISELLGWDESVKYKWNQRIQSVYSIK